VVICRVEEVLSLRDKTTPFCSFRYMNATEE